MPILYINFSCVLIHSITEVLCNIRKWNQREIVQLPSTALLFRKGSKGMVEAEAQLPLFFQLSLLSNGFIRQAKIFYKINQSHTVGFSASPGQQKSCVPYSSNSPLPFSRNTGAGVPSKQLPLSIRYCSWSTDWRML